MSLQDKYEEYKEKKEAREFFNQNNSVYISAFDLLKASIVGVVVATIGGYLSLMIGGATGFNFSIVFIFIGLATSVSMKRVINNTGMKLAIAVVLVYFIGMILGTSIYWMNYNELMILDMEVISYALQASFEYLFSGNIFSMLMIGIGAYVGFNDAK